MAITDNKVTATPTTVGVGSAGDLLIGSTPAELAANKAIFDAFPDAIKTKHDALIDYINVHPFYFESSVAAATANKGSFSGWVPEGAIVEIVMTNGNTSAVPTIVIDSVSHTITGMPVVAKVTDSVAQAYRFKKTGASALVFITLPDYVCEYCTSGEWQYRRYASGRSEAVSLNTSITLANLGAFGSGGLYILGGTGTIPAGFFTATPKIFGGYYAPATTIAGTTVYATSATVFGCYGLRSSSGSTATTLNVNAIGNWK